jgi:hypothetical protein
MRVLIIEGADFMSAAFAKVLLQQGHQPQRVKQVTEEGGNIKFELIDGQQADEAADVVLVDCCTHEPVKGTDIVRHFEQQDIPCIGISALPDANVALNEAGATLTLTKVAALAALFTGALSLEHVRDTPQQQQALVPSFERLPKDKQLRREMDVLITEG